jgi:hypothetical protein
MIRLLADEDFNNDILRGLVRRVAGVDVVRAQDVRLGGATDDAVLAGAAGSERVILTHDVSTLIGRALARIRAGEPMPGAIAVAQSLAVGAAIHDLVLVMECSAAEDWRDRVRYLPLR